MFDDYSTEINCEDDQDMFSSSNISDIFNNDIPWSLHYFPCSENLIPFEEIFPSYLNDPFDHNNDGRVDMSDPEIIIRNENVKVNESPCMESQQLPRKRSVLSSKKKTDRHSKIDTARGMRDRRMRLSREVARQFFDLQDMLGVDKASKAIEWLLVQSSSAIKALPNSASTSTDCGLLSSHLSEKKKRGEQTTTSLQKDASAVRESREKARARAKQRTRDKMLVQTLKAAGSDHAQPLS